MVSQLVSLLLVSLAAVAQSASLRLYISPSSQLPDPSTLPSSTHATLTGLPGSRLRIPLGRDNSFQFSNLLPGEYLLDVHSRDYVFPTLRVDVQDPSDTKTEPIEGQEQVQEDVLSVYYSHPNNAWDNRGVKLGGANDVARITVIPSARRQFYVQRTGFDLLGFFKSPMILMGLFSLGMVFGMPYLMENMDPETKAEFEEMQMNSPLTGSQGAASQIQNFDLASWMAGKSGSEASANDEGAQKSIR